MKPLSNDQLLAAIRETVQTITLKPGFSLSTPLMDVTELNLCTASLLCKKSPTEYFRAIVEFDLSLMREMNDEERVKYVRSEVEFAETCFIEWIERYRQGVR